MCDMGQRPPFIHSEKNRIIYARTPQSSREVTGRGNRATRTLSPSPAGAGEGALSWRDGLGNRLGRFSNR